MIYVFSNVQYPESRKLNPNPDDVLIFLNKAFSAPYYQDFPGRKILFRREDNEKNFGPASDTMENIVLGAGIWRELWPSIRKGYGWDYRIENDKNRGPTTGYMAVLWAERKFPGEEITLVNFGYNVKATTYRCPNHNWRFEAEKLARYKHVFTADTVSGGAVKTVYYTLMPWLGDSLYATAVLENLVATGKFLVNVSESHSALWRNCPFLDRSITPANADYRIREHNRHPWVNNCPHIIDGTVQAIEQDLGVRIPIITRTPRIYADIPAGRMISPPYILINTGWQNSCETKHWSRAYWRKLIHLMPEYTFVQFGQKINHAEPIDGAVNMIDRTDVLQLCSLIRDAECVVSPPSGCIHIAGALNRPFVSIAGGREPASLLNYPGGKVLCNCGSLNCCRNGGCRLSFFGGGQRECKSPALDAERRITAQCMLDITPETVANAIREVIR